MQTFKLNSVSLKHLQQKIYPRVQFALVLISETQLIFYFHAVLNNIFSNLHEFAGCFVSYSFLPRTAWICILRIGYSRPRFWIQLKPPQQGHLRSESCMGILRRRVTHSTIYYVDCTHTHRRCPVTRIEWQGRRGNKRTGDEIKKYQPGFQPQTYWENGWSKLAARYRSATVERRSRGLDPICNSLPRR